jgi:CBS domain-containing protein
MKIVNQLLEAKGREVWSIGPNDSVYDAVRRMAEKEIGALVVLDPSGIVGIMSERDYARQVILKGRASRETPVCEIMSEQVIAGRPEDTIESCLALMTEKRIRHLPIIDDGELVGLVSMGDLVKVIIAEQQATIEQLEHYITG